MAEEAFAIALYDYHSQNEEELTIKKSDRLLIVNDSGPWWQVQNERHQSGLVPSNYLQRTDYNKGKKSIVQKIFSRKGSSGGPSDHIEPPGYEAPECVSTSSESSTDRVDEAIVKYNYTPVREDEVALTKGDRVYVMEKEGDGWWRGEANGKTGWFPSNYVEIIKADNKESNVICKVRTLYAFTPTNNEELHFTKDTLLEIIDQPRDDPEWWKARKEDGTIGLVPKNYVKILDGNNDEKRPVPDSAGSTPVAVVDNSILNKEWYHGNISRQECERKLNASADGDFLVRASETKSGDFSVSMKAPDRIKHFRIKALPSNRFGIGQRTFSSLDELVEHYKKLPIFTCENGQKMYLLRPYPKQDHLRNGIQR